MAISTVEYDVHGLVGVRLIDPSEGDARAVSGQLGALNQPLDREPDLIIRFVRDLPTPRLGLIGKDQFGFTEDAFYVLRTRKAASKVRLDFNGFGSGLEIVCQTGLRAVPLLMTLVGLLAIRKGCAPLHASAFRYRGKGILVTGWAKGGKTEALLAFTSNGAEYVGDEMILLSGDGEGMFGVPEKVRLWDWHLRELPELQKLVPTRKKIIFNLIRGFDRLHSIGARNRLLRKAWPFQAASDALPAFRRQLNLTLPPASVFGESPSGFSGTPDKVFLMMSHEGADISIESADPAEIAEKMIFSNRFEQIPFLEHYLAFKFAFPQGGNGLPDRLEEAQSAVLCRALRHKEAYVVRHPYPCSLDALYRAMRPYCD